MSAGNGAARAPGAKAPRPRRRRSTRSSSTSWPVRSRGSGRKTPTDIAVEAGASRLTDRDIRPSVGLVFNRVPLWYFNYSDPETKKNVMTIAINAQNGEIVLNDKK